MTAYERIRNQLQRKPVDRIGIFEHFWDDTEEAWKKFIPEGQSYSDHFNLDMDISWVVNMTADINKELEIIEETDETYLARDGNGAVLRRHKHHDTTPEHIDFLVKDRAAWEEHIKPLLKPDHARINFKAYREIRKKLKNQNKFFCWAGVNVFELMHPVCGHEYMLMGMALDPDWVRDMVMTYATMIVQLQEILFEEEGYPDGIWYYEDMGFKERPFMSPAMYKEIIQPGHKLTVSYAKSKKLPVIMHSCGFVEPLLPGMIESGIDCLQVLEVKAGMDLLKIHKEFGHVLSLMGGIDVRTLYTNDRNEIRRELESKIPFVKESYGYILHSDHSIPPTVNYDSYRFFLEEGLRLGCY